MAVFTTLQDDLDQVPIQNTEFDLNTHGRKPESSSFGRGVDQLQASLYGFASAIGGLTGFDTLAEWGEEGVLRNIEEMKKNPPEIHSWDDVNSLSEFATYALEAIGEQAPQLLMDVALAIGGTVLTGVGGMSSVAARRAVIAGMTQKQKAAVGKKLKRMVGEPNFAKFQKLKGNIPPDVLESGGAALKALGTRAKTLSPAMIGMGVSNIAQNTGETQMGFLREGIDAPGTAILAGAVKGVLDTLVPATVAKMATKANVPVRDLPHLLARTAYRTVATGLQEGVTETAQTLVDHIAMNIHDPDFDMFDEEAMNELWTAGTKGAIIGGVLGGTGTAAIEAGRFHARRQELLDEEEKIEAAATKRAADRAEATRREQAEAAEVARRKENPVPTNMVPESQETIDAQARAVADPSSAKDTMEVTGGSPQPTEGILPPGTIAVPTQNGIAYTTNPRKATIIRRTGGDVEIMGRVLYNAPGGKNNATGEVVIARDAQGNVISERATNDAERDADIAEARRLAPAGGSVGVDTVENAVQARMTNSGAEVVGYGQDVAPGKGRIMLRGGKVQYKHAGSQIADEEAEIANEKSAFKSALIAAFPNAHEREGARRILEGEYEAKPGVKEALAKKVKPDFDRILREQDMEPHELVEELYSPPELDENGEPIEDMAPPDVDEDGNPIEVGVLPTATDEEQAVTAFVDNELIEGVAEAPVTRVALNTGLVVRSYNKVDYGNSEQMAYEAAAANAEALNGENNTDRFQVRQKRSEDDEKVESGYEIVELDGFDTESEAIAAKANYLKVNNIEGGRPATDQYTGEKLDAEFVPIDPAVAEIRTVKRGNKWYNEEHMLPSAFASSNIMQGNRNITTRGSQLTGLHTEESYVDEFLKANTSKTSTARRGLQEQLIQRGQIQAAELVDQSIIKFVDELGLPYEFIGTDLVDLGKDLLTAQGSTTTLDGQRFRFNAYTLAIAHLRARGLKQVPASKGQPTIIVRLPDGRTVRMLDAIVAGNKNFSTGKGKEIRLSELKTTDEKVRARGQDSAQTPFEPKKGEGTIDPNDAQIALETAQRRLLRTNRILAGIYTKQKELQKQRLERGMADVSDLDAELKKLSAREKAQYRNKHAALDTIEAFMDPDDPLVSEIVNIKDDKERRKALSKLFNLKGSQPHTVLTRSVATREEIAGRDGVEHSSNQREDGFLQESDKRTRADGANVQKEIQDVPIDKREKLPPPQPVAVSDNLDGVQDLADQPVVLDPDNPAPVTLYRTKTQGVWTTDKTKAENYRADHRQADGGQVTSTTLSSGTVLNNAVRGKTPDEFIFTGKDPRVLAQNEATDTAPANEATTSARKRTRFPETGQPGNFLPNIATADPATVADGTMLDMEAELLEKQIADLEQQIAEAESDPRDKGPVRPMSERERARRIAEGRAEVLSEAQTNAALEDEERTSLALLKESLDLRIKKLEQQIAETESDTSPKTEATIALEDAAREKLKLLYETYTNLTPMPRTVRKEGLREQLSRARAELTRVRRKMDEQPDRRRPTISGPIQPKKIMDAGLVDADGQRVFGAVGYGKVGKTVLNFVNGILKELGMDQVGMVVAGLGAIQDVVDAGHITREQKAQIEKMFESDPTRQAVFVPRGRSGVIITRPGLTNDKDLYLSVVGHEVGHGVFNAIKESIENPQTESEAVLAKRLKAAYEKEKTDDIAYADSMGEWFADKISARARNMVVKGDAGIIGRFFGKSVEMLRTVFNKTKAQTHRRFHPSIKFNNAIKAYKDDNVFARMQNMGYGDIESIQLPPLSSIAGSGITRRMFERGARAITALGKYTTPTAKSLVQKLFDLDNRLRMLGLDEIADLIYKATNTLGLHKAFWNMVETARREFSGRVNEIFPTGTKDIHKALIFWELVQELPTAQLSEKAKQVRAVIKDFHNYMVMAGLPIGEVENYFPRSYDIGKIMAHAQEFLQILQDGGMTRADALDTFEGMTGVQPRHTMEGYAPKRLGIMFDRKIPLDTARVLAEKGFLNADPMQALLSYMMKYTREAEHRRAFGGFHYLKDYVTSPTLARMNVVDKQAAEANNTRILEGYLERYGFFTPTTNPAAPPGQQAADFQAALAEAERRGFIRYDANQDVEWIHPDAKLDAVLEKVLAAKTANMAPEEAAAFRKQAEMLVDYALDRADPLDPTTLRYNVIGEVRAYESLRTLVFSGLASIPEVAVAFARAKGAVGMKEFGSIVVDAIKNPTELLEFARAIGSVQDDMGASLGTEMWSPWDAQTGNVRFFRNMLPYMMKINGNDKVVNYSRMIALKTGMRFLQESASQAMMGSARHIRYLEELNIDADTVLRWMAASTRRGEKNATTNRDRTAEGADAKRVRAALNRFIDESVLRPNAPERPTYAHHPIGTFVYHLKTFAYSFNKRVNGGLYREMQARWAENPSDKMAAALDSLYYIAPMLFVFMVFGAVGDELRERVKSLGANGTWGANNKDVTDTLGSWADRTGLFTSMPFFDPLWDTLSGNPNANSLAFGLGPTASHLYDLFGDEGITQNELVRSIPVISQVTGLREQLYTEGGRGNPYQNYRDTTEKA